MHKIVRFKWRVRAQNTGKWVTTRHLATEEEIRKEHPEAECLEWSREEREVPSTHAEELAAMMNYPSCGNLGVFGPKDTQPAAALLRFPFWGAPVQDERPLPLPPEAYRVDHHGDRSSVTVVATGEVVYNGIGPAEVTPPPPAPAN